MISKLKYRVRLFWLKGKKFTCPFCNYGARKLLPIGEDLPVLKEYEVIGGGRRYSLCPKCGSFDREMLVYLYLKDVLRLFHSEKKIRVLHIAPERRIFDVLSKNTYVEYVSGDKFTEGYDYPAEVVEMDVTEIPFDAGSFDIVICNHVLEHIPNDGVAMQEIYRVLKLGGTAILQVPYSKKIPATLEDPSITDPKIREKKFGQFDHVRLYGMDYLERLRNVGFNAEALNIASNYPDYALNEREEIFVINKI